jgi:hypothetical protein
MLILIALAAKTFISNAEGHCVRIAFFIPGSPMPLTGLAQSVSLMFGYLRIKEKGGQKVPRELKNTPQKQFGNQKCTDSTVSPSPANGY